MDGVLQLDAGLERMFHVCLGKFQTEAQESGVDLEHLFSHTPVVVFFSISSVDKFKPIAKAPASWLEIVL